MPQAATVGTSTTKDYRKTFYNAYPEAKGKLDQIHHAVPQGVLKKYPGRFTESQMHSLENLRGVPLGQNKLLHDTLRVRWYRFFRGNPEATREQILRRATQLDDEYGHLFLPPVR